MAGQDPSPYVTGYRKGFVMKVSILPWFWTSSASLLLVAAYAGYGGPSLVFLLMAVGLIMLQGALVQAGSPRLVRVTREWSPVRPTAGDSAELSLHIEFKGGLPPLWIKVHDPLAVRAGSPGEFVMLTGFRRHADLTGRVSGLRRGIYRTEKLSITYGDLFGWFTRTLSIEAEGFLTVVPKISSMPASGETGNLAGGESMQGGLPAGHKGELLRDYRPGDSWKSIHWKASSRRAGLLARVPEAGGPAERIILLSTDPGSYSPAAEEFELAVSCAASLLRMENSAGRRATLICGSRSDGGRSCGHDIEQEEGMNILAAVSLDAYIPGHSLLIETVQEHSHGLITFIIGRLTPEIASAAISAAARGIALEIITTGDKAWAPELSVDTIELLLHSGLRLSPRVVPIQDTELPAKGRSS
ncbi:DUF58 domain-containing protein [Paenibacillus sp. YPG26]|uniref:DUF58 domain-containing protein n=1 Tax=Paenibacillus sp. YPG26 TaxID=2878915 RepID=UPI00203F9D7A|nr:DUF58 domain-containing protein [Paenibacillus sp. YPG26]USB33855.1 DUF58 domain-containing protein [Paenibacillus sp. YPG26]